MPKILQLGSTNLVVVKYEEENIFPISFFYPLQANICKKIGQKSIFPYKMPICSKSQKKHQLNKKSSD